MRNKIRIKKLESMVGVRNYGLRVVMPMESLYSKDPESFLYWTDEPVKGMEALYNREPYREVQHPDGIKPTMKDM